MKLSSVSYLPKANFSCKNQNSKMYSGIPISPLKNDVFIKSSNSISFCGKIGKYDFKWLLREDVEVQREEMLDKLYAKGIGSACFGFDWYMMDDANIAIQAVNKLLDHEICENPTVIESLFPIAIQIREVGSSPYAKAVLEFADFITSDSMRDVYDNESVRDNLGLILLGTTKDNLRYKQNVVRFIAGHKELLDKDVDLGDYINAANIYSCDDIITELSKTDPSYNTVPICKSGTTKTNSSSRVDSKTTGRVMTKKDGEINGFLRIGGQSQAIEKLQKQVIWPKKYPGLYKGRSLEKAAILYGPPGTGKSLMATAFAEEYGAYCVKIGASDMSAKWVGASEENWRNLFDELREHQPALLFIDEIDALCKKRGSGDIHGDKELNQFLKLVSDIKAENLDVFILGATNNYEALDSAVIRDGRFGIHIEMLPPQDEKAVGEIFDIHTHNLALNNDVRKRCPEIFKKILELGLTGAEIEALIGNAHDEALSRLGLFEKMKNNIVKQDDYDSFNIEARDILTAIEKRRKETKTKTSSSRIGFIS